MEATYLWTRTPQHPRTLSVLMTVPWPCPTTDRPGGRVSGPFFVYVLGLGW